jgi:hypothetical protein
MYNIIDNFLSDEKFQELRERTINCKAFPLYLKQFVSEEENKDGIYFTHCFMDNGNINSSMFDFIFSLVDKKIKFETIYRIQLNVYPKTFFRKKHCFHVDYEFSHKACLLYLNTNNGKTELRNSPFNISINSIANRALFFDASKEHRSTTCTDSEFRSNIIFNYV